MPLAGVGSRFIALLIDMVLWFVGLLALFLLFWLFHPAFEAFSRLSAQWATALIIFLAFLFNWGYFTLFEAFWNGQTPGKRLAKIRVIQKSGRPIGLIESMARNFVRFIDQIPSFYGVGVIAMFATRQHQRLGDLAAGTLVVRDRAPETALWGEAGTRTFTAASFPERSQWIEPHTLVTLPAGDVAKLTVTDLEVLEGFLARRLDMAQGTREGLAERIAAAICAKSGLAQPDSVSTETFLEAVARDLRDAARLRS